MDIIQRSPKRFVRMARFYSVRPACHSSANLKYVGKAHRFGDSRGIPNWTRHRFTRQCFSFEVVIGSRRCSNGFDVWSGSFGTCAAAAEAFRKNNRIISEVDLICDALPFGRLWYDEPDALSNAIDYAKFYSRSHDAVIHVYDDAGNLIETHEHKGGSKAFG